jgi:hypothetical protein
MEYRGIEYRVIQGIKRGFWKWSVESAEGTRAGTSDSRDTAVSAAKRTIDRLLDPTKFSVNPQMGLHWYSPHSLNQKKGY